MTQLAELSLRELCEAVAKDDPTPGGGAVAALAGAVAAALVEMVAGLTLGKDAYAEVQTEMEEVRGRAHLLRQEFLGAMDEDVAAFDAVMAAYHLPKTNDAEKAARSGAIQEGLRRATLVPLTVVELSAEAAQLARVARDKGNANAASDAGVAVAMAKSALIGAGLNVEINLDGIKDEAFVAAARERLELYRGSV